MIDQTSVILKLANTHKKFDDAVHLVEHCMQLRALKSSFFEVKLNVEDFEKLYPQLPIPILVTLVSQFADREIGVWAVSGDNAIATMHDLKGLENNPSLCAHHTLRFRLAGMLGHRSFPLPVVSGRGPMVFDNYLHCPKVDEAMNDWDVLKKFF